MIRAILLDLDDTLYDEADYVASGFRCVAERIAASTGAEAAAVYAFMQGECARHGRGRVFDAALVAFGARATAGAVAALVETYRHHVPQLRLWPDADRVLRALRPQYRLAVVTDGLPVMQRAKLAALGLPERLDSIVCCWEHDAPKPDPRAYRIALAALGVTPAEALVVGDRPDHDMAAAQALGCRSVRIRRGRFAQAEPGIWPAEFEIDSLDALPGLLPWRESST